MYKTVSSSSINNNSFCKYLYHQSTESNNIYLDCIIIFYIMYFSFNFFYFLVCDCIKMYFTATYAHNNTLLMLTLTPSNNNAHSPRKIYAMFWIFYDLKFNLFEFSYLDMNLLGGILGTISTHNVLWLM